MEPFETFEHAGFVCELHQDEEPSSPAEWDELGTLHAFKTFNRDEAPGEPADHGAQEAWERGRPGLVVRYLAAKGETAVPFWFEDYGSSGAHIRALDDDEDARASGYISTTVARGAELGIPDKPDEAVRQLRGELTEWDAWVAGEVVGYVVRDPKTREVVDSVWGFYPDEQGDGLEEVRAEARAAAEAERAERLARTERRRTGWALARVQS